MPTASGISKDLLLNRETQMISLNNARMLNRAEDLWRLVAEAAAVEPTNKTVVTKAASESAD